MRFQDLSADIINQIYEYLNELYIWHCNLTRSAIVAAEVYDLHQQVHCKNSKRTFQINDVEQLTNFIILKKKYNNLLYHLCNGNIAKYFGCECGLTEVISLDHLSASYRIKNKILYMIFEGKTLKEMAKELKILKEMKTNYELSDDSELNEDIEDILFDIYVHLSDEADIDENMRCTIAYRHRQTCRGHWKEFAKSICNIKERIKLPQIASLN